MTAWRLTRDGDPTALAIYERHYSARRYHDDRRRRLFVGPGEKLVLLSDDRRGLFVWRRFVDDSGQTGVNCAVFRNEGVAWIRSSALITEADSIAWDRWPRQRLYTYVDGASVASPNPGYCFKMAGWRWCGRTKGGHGRRPQEILEMRPEWVEAVAA